MARLQPLFLTPSLIAAALLGAACNAPPEGGAIAIGPDAPTTLDDLLLTVTEEAVDPNDHTIDYDVTWVRNGAEVTEAAGLMQVPAALTAKDELWQATAVPIDEKGEPGPALTAEITVLNALPTASVEISPESPQTGAALSATATGEDADGDAVTFTYAWLRDGSATSFSSADLPEGETSRGETWTVRVTPDDGDGQGAVAEASVDIDNAPPEALSVRISPTDPRTTTELTALAEGADLDGDPLTWTYTWSINDVAIPDVSGGTLASSLFVKGDTVSVQAVPSDGFVEGNSVDSDSVVVLNTAPSAGSINITPDILRTGTSATCVVSDWADADGDPESYRYRWTVDGVEAGTAATLDASAFAKGDVVVCSATPDDGEDLGTEVTSDARTVANTPPGLISASLSPTDPKEADTITVSPTGVTDADDDTVSFTYNWLADGTAIGVTTATLTGLDFAKGQEIEVEVTPTDGTDSGTTVTSSAVTVANTAPVMSGVTTSPSTVYTSTPLTATPAASDADGDTLSYSYAWFLQDEGTGGFTRLSTTSSTLPATSFDKADVLYVQVAALDGDDISSPLDSDRVTVLNTAPPTPGSVTLTPTSPSTSDGLNCRPAAVADIDGDALRYEYSFIRNGTRYTSTTTPSTSVTLSSSGTAPGETWRCDVRAFDGAAYSSTRSSSTVTITSPVSTYSFTETSSDDVTPTSLRTFFSGLGTIPTSHYLFFEVDGASTTSDGAWCAERADWYASEYLSAGTSSVSRTSGSWQKWSRGIGGSWSSPTTAGYLNFFGSGCASGPYDWCSEWGIGGKRLGVFPNRTGTGETYAGTFAPAGWKLTIKVGSTRAATCGF